MKYLKPEWDIAMYSAAEAARLVGLGTVRVRRWLKGYEYWYESQIRHQRPVVRRRSTAGTTYASFLDLVDLLFIKNFLDYGISLQKIRKALDEAANILGTDHFARQIFFTDGRNVYLKVKDEAEDILQLLSGGQWVIAPIIQKLATQIEFEASTGIARRWYPMGPNGLVVLDPLISFGHPTIVGRGIATANVYDLFVAENRNENYVKSWMSLTSQEIGAAIKFEERLAA